MRQTSTITILKSSPLSVSSHSTLQRYDSPSEKDKFKRTGPKHLADIEIYWFDDKDMAKTKLGVMSIHKGYYSELLILHDSKISAKENVPR